MARLVRRGLRHVAAVATALGLLLGAGPKAHAKGPVLVDEQWIDPAFATHDPARVAVLPAVNLLNFDPSHLATDLFFNECRGDGRAWLPPALCRLRFGATPRERDSVFRALALQVRRDGRPDAATVAELARRLGVDALVFVRIDRWEHVTNPAPSTQIEARVEMLDSTGASLWRSRARSRMFGESVRASVEMPAASSGLADQTSMIPGVAASGSAGGATAAGGSTATSTSPGATTYSLQQQATTKLQELRPITAEDVQRMRPVAVSEADVPFEAAARALVAAWATQLPARPGAAPGDRPPAPR